jgi:hypothetical protein
MTQMFAYWLHRSLRPTRRREPMTGNYEERWKEICAKAAVEKDPAKMLELIAEINRLLDEKFHHPSHDATQAKRP